MTKEEFPRRLREWRKANGLTSKELGKLLGLSEWAIHNYEQGKSIPSKEIADKLASICGMNDIPHGRHCIYRNSNPFSNEERKFAEEHHGIVYHYLNTRKLSEDDWYDIVVFGYLHAVRIWFSRSDLHKFSFTTIACNYMRSAVNHEYRKRSNYKIVSLDDIIHGSNGLTYGDMLCDPRDCVRT